MNNILKFFSLMVAILLFLFGALYILDFIAMPEFKILGFKIFLLLTLSTLISLFIYAISKRNNKTTKKD